MRNAIPLVPLTRINHIHVHDILYSCFKARQDYTYIQESRRIREEQDQEYQESLQIDQKEEEERLRAKADKVQKEQLIIEIYCKGGTRYKNIP